MGQTITNAGIEAAILAGTTGPQIIMSHFKIGSSSGFEADPALTDVVDEVFDGAATGLLTYSIVNANAVRYRVTLPESIGDFAVGNIGIYLSDGTLFAIVVKDSVDTKTATAPNITGNRLVYDIVLILNNQAVLANLTLLVEETAAIPVVADETELPTAAGAEYPLWLVQNHTEIGHPVLSSPVSGSWWHTRMLREGVDALESFQGVGFENGDFDGAVNVGETVYFNSGTGLFERASLTNEPIGLKGSKSNLITSGSVYTAPSGTPFTPGDKLYVDGTTDGVLTTTPTAIEVGTAIANNRVLVSIRPAEQTTVPFPSMWKIGFRANYNSTNSMIFLRSGECRDENNQINIYGDGASSTVKRIDQDWAEGTNVGGFPSALTLAQGWYAMYIIAKEDGTIDFGYDSPGVGATNLLTDTLSSGFIYARRIGFVYVNGSLNVVKHLQGVNNENQFIWDVQRLDFDSISLSSGVRTLITTSTPPSKDAMITVALSSGAKLQALITSPYQTDTNPASETNMTVGTHQNDNVNCNDITVRTNTLSQIGAVRGTTAYPGTSDTFFRIISRGWIDYFRD